MTRYDSYITGDIGDDGRHPNSPNYVAPAYGPDDAAREVAGDLTDADEIGELVEDFIGSLAILRWANEQDMPRHLQPRFRELLRKAEALDKAVDAKLDNWRTAA